MQCFQGYIGNLVSNIRKSFSRVFVRRILTLVFEHPSLRIKLTISSGSSPLIRDTSEFEGTWLEENKYSCPLIGIESLDWKVRGQRKINPLPLDRNRVSGLEGTWPEENKSSAPR